MGLAPAPRAARRSRQQPLRSVWTLRTPSDFPLALILLTSLSLVACASNAGGLHSRPVALLYLGA